MKKAVSLTILSLSLSLHAGSGQADVLSAAKKDLHKGEKAVEKGASASEKTVAKDAKSAEHTVAKDTRHAFSASEMDDLGKSAKHSFDAELKAGASDYNKAIAEAKKVYTEAEEAALRSAAGKYLERYSGFLGKLHGRIEAMAQCDEAMAKVKRLVQSAADRKFDAQVSEDIKEIGQVLGLVEGDKDSIVPGETGGALRSSWGIAIGVRGLVPVDGAQVGGDGVVGFVAASQAAGQTLPYTFFVQPGLVLAAGSSQLSGGLIFFWQPGTPAEAQALKVGLTGSFSVRSVSKAPEQQKVTTTITLKRDAETGKVIYQPPSMAEDGTVLRGNLFKGRVAYVRGADVVTGGGGAATTALTMAPGAGIGLGVTAGVLWKVLGDPFKGSVSFPHGQSAAIPGFYIEPTLSAQGGFNGGIQVSQTFIDSKLLNQASQASTPGR